MQCSEEEPNGPTLTKVRRELAAVPDTNLSPVEPGKPERLAAIVVPARLESERLPGKLLKDATGQPLIAYTLQAALKASKAADVGFVTDNQQLHKAVTSRFKGSVLPILSRKQAVNGSHRVGLWVDHFDAWDTYDVVVNLQADEPCIDPRDLDNLIAACSVTEQICTLVRPLHYDDWQDPNVVKAWLRGNHIRDFSRSMTAAYAPPCGREHVGVYAFPQQQLDFCLSNKVGKRAKEMRLEQLTWVDDGRKIIAVELKHTTDPISVNTPRDYARFIQWCRARE